MADIVLILMAISLISPVHPLSWGSGSAPARRLKCEMSSTDRTRIHENLNTCNITEVMMMMMQIGVGLRVHLG